MPEEIEILHDTNAIQRFLDKLVQDVLQGKIEVRKANSCRSIVNLWLRINKQIEIKQLQKEIDELQDAVKAKEARSNER